jgi:hypothetical protein
MTGDEKSRRARPKDVLSSRQLWTVRLGGLIATVGTLALLLWASSSGVSLQVTLALLVLAPLVCWVALLLTRDRA